MRAPSLNLIADSENDDSEKAIWQGLGGIDLRND
jgi:hypothetical protein